MVQRHHFRTSPKNIPTLPAQVHDFDPCALLFCFLVCFLVFFLKFRTRSFLLLLLFLLFILKFENSHLQRTRRRKHQHPHPETQQNSLSPSYDNFVSALPKKQNKKTNSRTRSTSWGIAFPRILLHRYLCDSRWSPGLLLHL